MEKKGGGGGCGKIVKRGKGLRLGRVKTGSWEATELLHRYLASSLINLFLS